MKADATPKHDPAPVRTTITISPPKKTLHVLMFREGGNYVAKCLEHSYSAQGRDYDDVWGRFVATTIALMRIARNRGKEPFANLPSAEPWYWMKYLQDEDIRPEPKMLTIAKPDPTGVEYKDSMEVRAKVAVT